MAGTLPSDAYAASDASLGLDSFVRPFEKAWQAGARPTIDDYLPPTGTLRRAVLRELVHNDLEYRLKAGEPARAEEYLGRYPELAEDRSLALELIAAEYRLRRRSEPGLGPDEYRHRFPQYHEATTPEQSLAEALTLVHVPCPQCRNVLEVVPDRRGEHLTCPACGSAFTLDRDSLATPSATPGGRLGRFELLEVIGRGAFGVVYRARDPELDRLVAVKIPRLGTLTSPEDVDRFLREARSAAQLRHAGVVAVHDAGQVDGTCFLVSELVDGKTLADLLRQRRPTPSEAAHLVAAVADALHYAHARGVVHRDVKPSNILVDQAGRPHVTDFGLAKRDAGEVTVTQDGQVLGTPAYMSPEQASGEAHGVDGRTDVYSLGAVLYELLTGELPFRGNTRMVLHQVLHQEPRPPRSLNDHVPRDLETICLKCLQKERGRRYQSAQALAEDLRRFLAGEPIKARPVGGLERLARWCRRKPALAGLTGGLIAVFVVGAAAATWQWRRAEHQRGLAEASRRKAHEAVQDYFTRVSENQLLRKPGLQELRKQLLETALAYDQDFLRERADDPAMQAEVAAAHVRVAVINDQVGSVEAARQAYQEALALYEKLVRVTPADAELAGRLAQTYNQLGGLYSRMSLLDPALDAFDRSRTILERLVAEHPDAADYQGELARTHLRIGTVYQKKGQKAEAQRTLEQVRAMQRELIRGHSDRAEFQAELASTLSALGTLHTSSNRLEEGLASLTEAADVLRQLVKAHPDVAQHQSDLSDVYGNIANVHREAERLPQALAAWQEVCALREKLVHDNPAVSEFQWGLAVAYSYLGKQYSQRSQLSEAMACWRQAYPLVEKLLRINPGFADYRHRLADLHNGFGHVESHTDQADEALLSFERAREILEPLIHEYPDTAMYQHALAINRHNYANELQKTGRRDEARPAFEHSRDLCERLVAADPSNLAYRLLLTNVHNKLGWLHERAQQLDEARDAYGDALRVAKGLRQARPESSDYAGLASQSLIDLGRVAKKTGRPEEAERFFTEALAIREGLARTKPDVTSVLQQAATACRVLADFRRETGQSDEALTLYERCRIYCDRALRTNQQDLRARNLLGEAWDGTGQTLAGLGKADEALRAYQGAIEWQRTVVAQAPKQFDYREDLGEHYEHLAALYRELGRPAEAAATTRQRLQLWPKNPDELYAGARDLARCVPLVGKDRSDLTDAERAERTRYAEEAVGALRQAVANGFRGTGRLAEDADLVPLRERKDYRELMRGLEKKTKDAGPSPPP